MVAALYVRTLFADLTHVVEEQRLYLIVLGFFSALEQRVVDLGEDPGQVLSQTIHHQLATALHQFAEAWLNATVGKGLH